MRLVTQLQPRNSQPRSSQSEMASLPSILLRVQRHSSSSSSSLTMQPKDQLPRYQQGHMSLQLPPASPWVARPASLAGHPASPPSAIGHRNPMLLPPPYLPESSLLGLHPPAPCQQHQVRRQPVQLMWQGLWENSQAPSRALQGGKVHRWLRQHSSVQRKGWRMMLLGRRSGRASSLRWRLKIVLKSWQHTEQAAPNWRHTKLAH
mmetsp:Transcript_14172/g.42764  ORF Transcript_14172/g.42764 Transcript_14172/m.42764 type:complete len:205 (-) Transcript_14172:339-953(-)